MESRVLSRATTFAGIPHLRKLPRENTSICFVSARPIGTVVEGGNLICGRQLRPALLLEILRPCLAAASSPAEGSDSSGEVKPVGFFNKYPALVILVLHVVSHVHFLNLSARINYYLKTLSLYFLNVIFNILNKKIYNYFPYPYFVSEMHLFVGVVYCLISWTLGLPKRYPIDSNLLKRLVPVAVCHALGHVTSNVSFAAVAVSFTHTIKALEPFFNASASQFILGQPIPITLWLSLAPVVLGLFLAPVFGFFFMSIKFLYKRGGHGVLDQK